MSYSLKDLAMDYVQNKIEHVSDDKYKERLEICNICEYKNQVLGVCKKCGCLLKEKAKHVRAECPIGKW